MLYLSGSSATPLLASHQLFALPFQIIHVFPSRTALSFRHLILTTEDLLPKRRWQMYCRSFNSSFIVLIYPAMLDAASRPLQCAVNYRTSSRTSNLPQNEIPFLFSSHHWCTSLKRDNPLPLGTARPQPYHEILASECPLHLQSVSSLVAPRLHSLLILPVRARKHKVRSGEYKWKAMAQLEI